MVGSPSPGHGVLRGRESECAQLDEFLTAVRAGQSRKLLVVGEAGVGKSALLEHLMAAARDLNVLRAVGVESDMELAFAGLHQLCTPMFDRVDRLPGPQRDALKVVLGQTAGPAPDRFLVGLAVLSLLSDAADERPVVCVVDDAQWLDSASEHVLAFVARRLRVERAGLGFAARQSGDGLRGLPRMEVHGLHNGDARALLSSAVQFTLDTDVVDRIVAETRGNPLALLELPQGRSATDLAGGFGPLAGQELSGRIEESFSRRLELLADDTRRLLLVAAAEPVGDPLLLWAAVERLGVDVSSWDAVETGGLLRIDQRVTFRHPLARSAVYRSAPPHERRAAHLALAEVTDPGVDPDRRAWHLASAAAGPDEDVAVQLERSADRAQARGGLAAAAAFLQRAVALTRDPQRRGERALVAADISLQAGAVDAALRLLAIAQAGPPDEMQQVRLDLVRAEATYAQSRGSDAPSLFLRAAKALERLDPALARETYVGAWSAALFAGGLATTDDLQSVSRAALAGPAAPDPPSASDLLLDGLSLAITEGRHAGTPLLQEATSEFVAGRVTSSEVLRWGWLAGLAAATVWDFDTILLMAEREVANARKAGALTVLALAANVLAQAVALCGDFAQSGLLIAEADAVTDATNSRIAPYGALVLAALQGREADGSALIETTIAEATAGGQGVAVQYAQWAAAVLFNGLGRYERARDAARAASADATELYVAAWATSELVEAASRAGDRETACDAL